MIKLKIVIVLLFFTAIPGLYSQVQLDTYVWNFSDSISLQNAPHNDIVINQAEREYQTSLVKNIFKRIHYLPTDPLADFYTITRLQEIMNDILGSDEIVVDRKSYVYEIMFGNFQDPEFGLKRVTVYSHIFIDIEKRKIVPGIAMSFIY